MRSRMLGGLMVTACLALAGCGDQEARNPSEPRPAFSHIGLPTCDLGFNSLISQYFTEQSRKQAVQNLRQQMAADFGADLKPQVQADGFGILANIEAAVNLGESSNATLGSELANRVLECMFTTAELSSTDPPGITLPVDFVQELTVHGLGGFGVRWANAQLGFDSADAVVSHDGFSATGPTNGSSWSASLPETVLIYGERTSSSVISYDWHKIRPAVTFTQPIVIAFCFGTSVSLVQEDNTFIPFVDPDYLAGSGFCPSILGASAARGDRNGWGVLALARRLVGLFGPSPAQAAMLVSHGTTAGKGGYSHFNLGSVPQVDLKVPTPPPPSNPPVGSPIGVTVRAQSPDKSNVNGVCVAVFGINNNGVRKALIGQHQCDLPNVPSVLPSTPTALTTGTGEAAGTATLSVCATDPGGLKILAIGKIDGRSSITVTNGLSGKINVKPSTATCPTPTP